MHLSLSIPWLSKTPPPPPPPPPTHNQPTKMARTSLSLILLSFTSLLFLLITPQTHAQSAPAPSPPGPINITAILVKGGQYTTFIRLLKSTQAADQINGQVNSSRDGMTVFAPTDNAFTNLPRGTLNDLSPQQQVQLVQYHVLPKYYTLSDFQTVSNPVRTQVSGQDGKTFGLYFSSEGNQVNVSTTSSSGGVVTQVNNALRQESPLAVYQVDKVLLPVELTAAAAPAPAPPTGKTTSSSSSPDTTKSSPAEPAPANDSGRLQLGFGLVAGLGLLCMGLLL